MFAGHTRGRESLPCPQRPNRQLDAENLDHKPPAHEQRQQRGRDRRTPGESIAAQGDEQVESGAEDEAEGPEERREGEEPEDGAEGERGHFGGALDVGVWAAEGGGDFRDGEQGERDAGAEGEGEGGPGVVVVEIAEREHRGGEGEDERGEDGGGVLHAGFRRGRRRERFGHRMAKSVSAMMSIEIGRRRNAGP